MPDCVSLQITTEQRITATNELTEAKEKFPDIDIDISDSEINFTGEVYEQIIKCKYYFEIKLGLIRVRPNRRRTDSIGQDQSNPDSALPSHSKYVTYEKIDVVVVKANIIEYDRKVDCIVNTTNNKLEAHSQISKAINDAGGQPYEAARDSVKQQASKLKVTECIATKAGNMQTQYIIHAMCPVQADYTFKMSNKEMKNDVFSTVFNCLKMAEDLGLNSIAMPFISTGIL